MFVFMGGANMAFLCCTLFNISRSLCCGILSGVINFGISSLRLLRCFLRSPARSVMPEHGECQYLLGHSYQPARYRFAFLSCLLHQLLLLSRTGVRSAGHALYQTQDRRNRRIFEGGQRMRHNGLSSNPLISFTSSNSNSPLIPPAEARGMY